MQLDNDFLLYTLFCFPVVSFKLNHPSLKQLFFLNFHCVVFAVRPADKWDDTRSVAPGHRSWDSPRGPSTPRNNMPEGTFGDQAGARRPWWPLIFVNPKSFSYGHVNTHTNPLECEQIHWEIWELIRAFGGRPQVIALLMRQHKNLGTAVPSPSHLQNLWLSLSQTHFNRLAFSPILPALHHFDFNSHLELNIFEFASCTRLSLPVSRYVCWNNVS